MLFYRYHSKRGFLFKPLSLISHGVAIAFPFVWNAAVTEGAHGSSMVHDVLAKLNFAQFTTYIAKVLLFPFDVFARWLPVSILALYFVIRKRQKKITGDLLENQYAKTAVWILIFNIMPYWLAPETHVRYIMPLYPLIAFVLGYMIWQLGKNAIRITFLMLVVCIVLRYVAGIWGFPYYEAHYRGNYEAVARDILSITQDRPLYANDVTAAGISVAAHIEGIQFPNATLKFPDAHFKEGFLISHTSNFLNARIQKTYLLGNQKIYLLVSD
jgi:hypothetical protein